MQLKILLSWILLGRFYEKLLQGLKAEAEIMLNIFGTNINKVSKSFIFLFLTKLIKI